jgi:glucosamine--fructose-6-phosphate aminotransferase (isomerizing)
VEKAITKFASDEGKRSDAIDLVANRSNVSQGHSIGIAHTRWATHGGKTDANAHPHSDSSGKIALVHNGTINNSTELRKELQALGYSFEGTTDSEVIAKLIGHYYAEDSKLLGKPASLKAAMEKALSRCDGSWGLAVLCTDKPDKLYVARNGSPMVVGLGDDRVFVASDTTAFSRYTKNIISIKDGEIGVLHADARALDLSRTQQVTHEPVEASPPTPFPHWTLKEILEQPEAVARALGYGGRLTSEKVSLGGLDQVSIHRHVKIANVHCKNGQKFSPLILTFTPLYRILTV